jgi:hypothetical protein
LADTFAEFILAGMSVHVLVTFMTAQSSVRVIAGLTIRIQGLRFSINSTDIHLSHGRGLKQVFGIERGSLAGP